MNTKMPVKQAARTLSVVSLFASCGIGDIGIREAGGELLVAAELDARRFEFLRRNFLKTPVVAGDLQQTQHEVVGQARRKLGGREL